MKFTQENPDQQVSVPFLEEIEYFFNDEPANKPLLFIEHWVQLVFAQRTSTKRYKVADVYFYYKRIIRLFESCFNLLQDHQQFNQLKSMAKVELNVLTIEKHNLNYFPYLLHQKELLNPLRVLKLVFKKRNSAFYQQTFQQWLEISLNNSTITQFTICIIPLYHTVKKLVEACWLIYERLVTKNSFATSYQSPLLNFALTAPYLFDSEEVNNPFAKIEAFFSFTNLSGYRAELTKWFLAASNEEQSHENPSNLLFICNQFLQLLQAGYLITTSNLTYNSSQRKNFSDQLLKNRDRQIEMGELLPTDELPYLLEIQHRKAPLAYCKDILTLPNIIQLRHGLSEWLDAGLSDQSSINSLAPTYGFEQYLTLQKLIEAFYLMITLPNEFTNPTQAPANEN